jgi:hypothetical protein
MCCTVITLSEQGKAKHRNKKTKCNENGGEKLVAVKYSMVADRSLIPSLLTNHPLPYPSRTKDRIEWIRVSRK